MWRWVSGMLMLSVTSTRRLELDWMYRGAGRFFPTMTGQMHAAADRLYEQITNPA
jgi:hypothetical protein